VSGDSLLLRKAPIDSHKHVEETFQGIKEGPIVQVAPSHLDGGADFVALQLATQLFWYAGVQQNSQAEIARLSSYSLFEEHGLR
jgi:hypothetical protein